MAPPVSRRQQQLASALQISARQRRGQRRGQRIVPRPAKGLDFARHGYIFSAAPLSGKVATAGILASTSFLGPPHRVHRHHMLRTIELPRDVFAPRRARHAVASICAEHDTPLTRDGRLLVSEVVSNSVQHGEGDTVRLVLDVDHRGRLRCEVIDAGNGFVPVARARDRTESGGWGLELVERLSERWGVREGSTHVWFELSLLPAAASD